MPLQHQARRFTRFFTRRKPQNMDFKPVPDRPSGESCVQEPSSHLNFAQELQCPRHSLLALPVGNVGHVAVQAPGVREFPLRLSLADCFRSLRLRLKRVFTKMEFSCCKKPYSIRYKVLHRTVTNQSTKHLLRSGHLDPVDELDRRLVCINQ